MTQALRTAEERFDNLPDFAYAPSYVDDLDGIQGLRIAYLDEGPADAEHTFLCLHGQPTGQARRRRLLHLRPPPRHPARPDPAAGSAQHHTRGPGLGAACWD